MSTFTVPVKKISKVWNHPDADRLDLANVEEMTWQFVVGRDEYKEGDLVVYFPIDSLLPATLIEFLGVGNFLAGSKKNRVKTARLRGIPSQGLVVRADKISEYLDSMLPPEGDITEFGDGDDLLETLGVEKYEPPPIMSKSGNLVKMPGHVSVFDVEGTDNYPDVVELLMDQPVFVTEKLEGTNWWCSAAPDGQTWVGQRNYAINEIETDKENVYWACARKQGLLDFCVKYAQEQNVTVTLRGEMVGPGIQKNHYELKEHKVFLFAMQSNSVYMSTKFLFNVCHDNDLAVVPLLMTNMASDPPVGSTMYEPDLWMSPPTLRAWLDKLGRETVQDASNGRSNLCNHKMREGIVIVPAEEQRHLKIGRLSIKKRSPDYLAKTDF